MTSTVTEASFGQGHHEPYARALRRGGGTLTLRRHSAGMGTDTSGGSSPGTVEFDVLGWCAEASMLERLLLQSLDGPVLDVGCGPGRMLSAAQSLGVAALGIDPSAQAVRCARNRGVRALEQSVFSEVPQSGHWQSVLLLDGNIGIGGNISRLLRRCRQLIAPSGTLLVEVEADDDVDASFRAVLEDGDGNLSEPFFWARAGKSALEARAQSTGWTVASTQRTQGRVFCRLTPCISRIS
ncbi:class I SAM-dependent methyltransferase [Pseudarthrobacter sp. N5]|uniref:class I SAM-dependent methyltransferase n=1 Tax=Pseudarthrobacter sp. N5 TaxID=3418416 RepID=UPI003CEA47C8